MYLILEFIWSIYQNLFDTTIKILSTIVKFILFSIFFNLIIFLFSPNLAFWMISRPFYCITFTKLTWQIMKNPHSEKAFYYRGMYRSEYGSSKGAISDFTQAIEIRSKKHTLKQIAAPYYQRGQEYKEIGDLEKAISDYTIAAKIHKQNGQIWNSEFILQERQDL